MQIFQQLIFLHSTLTIRSDVASKLLLLLLLRAVFIVDNCRLCCLQFIRSFYFDRLLYSSSTYSLILVPFISYYCCCHFSSIDLPIALWVVSASFARFDHIIYDCLWARSIVCIRCCCWCLSSPRIYVSGTLLLPFVVLMHMCIAAAVPSIQRSPLSSSPGFFSFALFDRFSYTSQVYVFAHMVTCIGVAVAAIRTY